MSVGLSTCISSPLPLSLSLSLSLFQSLHFIVSVYHSLSLPLFINFLPFHSSPLHGPLSLSSLFFLSLSLSFSFSPSLFLSGCRSFVILYISLSMPFLSLSFFTYIFLFLYSSLSLSPFRELYSFTQDV